MCSPVLSAQYCPFWSNCLVRAPFCGRAAPVCWLAVQWASMHRSTRHNGRHCLGHGCRSRRIVGDPGHAIGSALALRASPEVVAISNAEGLKIRLKLAVVANGSCCIQTRPEPGPNGTLGSARKQSANPPSPASPMLPRVSRTKKGASWAPFKALISL